VGLLQGKKVLVVDDEEGIRDLIVSELEFNGVECFQAANGHEAFEIYQKHKMDAVISDIRMPDGDGLFFLDQLRKFKLDPCTMIFITGFTDVPLEEFYHRGVEAVIAKPFRLEQLVNTLELALTSPRMAWRKDPRVVAVLNIEVNWAKLPEPVRAKTFNLGRGGIFVQMMKELPKVGSRAKFTLHYTLEGREETLQGELVVRWVRSEAAIGLPIGFGGEFVGFSQEQMDEIASVAGLARTRVYIPKN
jgi:CheY-like chemotaxis protein